jgi:ribosome assembly protein 1
LSSDATSTIAPFFAEYAPAAFASASASGSGEGDDTGAHLQVQTHNIDLGFQIITQNGPIAEEPMMGVGFVLEGVVEAPRGDAAASEPATANFGGQVIAAVKEACKWAFLAQPVRIMTAMYICDLLCTSGSLGKVYAVLAKRNSKILSEDMQEGTDSFVVRALIPVTDSFGFAEEIRRKSSGL